MKKIISIILLSFFCSSQLSSQSGWFSYYPLNSVDQLLNIQFLNVNTGYVTGQYSIFKTTNSGASWIDISSSASSWYYALHFLNANTGYVGGHYSSQNGRILKTTNGGQNWIIQQTGIYDQQVSTVYALDENNVIIGENFASTNGQIFKSTNGGQNWISVFYNAYKGIQCIKFVNSLTGFACGTSFWKSTDAGSTWIEKSSIPYSYIHYGLGFLNENTGYCVGINSIAKTTNGGDNWIIQNPGVNTYLFSVSFVNINTGMVTGDVILKTTNGGENWLNVLRPVNSHAVAIQLLNADTVFCSGYVNDSIYNSLVLKSYNGGTSGINNISSNISKDFRLQQNYPNPFNPTTSIKYQVESTKFITLKVYNILGIEISTLVNEKQSPGTYEVKFDGTNLPSGVYYYKLSVDNVPYSVKKMVLLK